MIEAPDLFVLAYKRAFHPSLAHVLQALERGVLSDSPSLRHALKDMQQHEVSRREGGREGGREGMKEGRASSAVHSSTLVPLHTLTRPALTPLLPPSLLPSLLPSSSSLTV